MTKKFPTSYFRNCTSYNCGFWYTCVKWWYLQQFFVNFFQNSDFFQVFQSSSINAKMKFWGVPHLPHMCVIYTYFICHICHKLIVIMYVTTLDAVIFFVLFSYWRILSTILISISRVFLRVIYLILFSIIAILKIKNYVIKNFGVIISIISFWLSYTSHEDGPFD